MHHFFIVLNDDDGVAQVAQLLQDADEARCVAAVEADAGFVEDVERADEGAAQTCGKVDALAFAAAEAIAQAVECEVVEAYVAKELQATAYFCE